MSVHYIAQTKFLNLRWASFDDDQFIYELTNDAQWQANIGDKDVHNLQDARRYIQQAIIDSYQSHGFGLYIVESEEGLPVGLAGLLKRDGAQEIELGYAIHPNYRQQGIAKAATELVLFHAKHQLKLTEIVAMTTITNLPSMKVLLSHNFKLVASFCPNDSEKLVNKFQINYKD